VEAKEKNGMTDEPIASRTFTRDDQLSFARLSSDWNPMHLDSHFARRTQAGAPVVHGIHTLLWAIDAVLRSQAFDIQNIRARFQQPLFPHEIAGIRIRSRTQTAVHIEVVAANTVIAAIRLSSQPGPPSATLARQATLAPQTTANPVDVPFEQLANRKGAVAAGAGDDEVAALFPALSDAIGPPAIGALLATSQIVGMACPGLHSLFAGLDVSRDPSSDGERALCYAVGKVDARFRSLQIEVSGSGVSGRLDAFARHPPPAQPGMTAISARVRKGAFAGQSALIIGGSRGLGEVTAKIFAGGGGRPIITYFEAKHEAEAVAAEIRQAGGPCDVVRYDALAAVDNQLDGVGAVDGCYYFASGKIFQRKSALYEPEKLAAFLRYYADGFYQLCTTLARTGTGRLGVFYPSTVAVDAAASAVAEYAMAKAAGEILANYINAFLPNIQVITKRLPRILTDQTATIGVARAQDALDVMLPIVYEVQDIARS
jgi:acyl dehydratase/NAD(P)-dependent dehydrogenase (short-subunit alcohol dehydrogenase family)